MTSENQVYSWGTYRRGALGFVSNEDIKAPKKVKIHAKFTWFGKLEFFEDKKVVKITTGSDFNYALTQVNSLWVSPFYIERMEESIHGEIMTLDNWDFKVEIQSKPQLSSRNLSQKSF